ncbi:MAG: D-2-hydroxyacid dehydrogenase family protein, partial [Acidimicrobiales bacterium]
MSAGSLRVALLDDYQGVALDLLARSPADDRLQYEAFTHHIDASDMPALVARLAPFEAVVAMRERTAFDKDLLAQLPNLRVLVTTGMGNAAIDLDACRERGVTVCGTSGSVQSTAELTWALILAAARHLPTELANVRQGGWMTTVGTDLHGATLGLAGLGRIGAMVATVGRAFGMRAIAWSQNLTAERCAEVGVELVSRDQLFAESDFLSVHLVLSERTRGLIGAAELTVMKPTAWLINTSRGPICDEDALATACARGVIAGAALDAFGTEPLPPGHPFRTLPNVLASPHIGYVSHNVYDVFYRQIAEDLVAYLNGSPLRVLEPIGLALRGPRASLAARLAGRAPRWPRASLAARLA